MFSGIDCPENEEVVYDIDCPNDNCDGALYKCDSKAKKRIQCKCKKGYKRNCLGKCVPQCECKCN